MRTIGPNDPPRRPGPGQGPDGSDASDADATRRVDPASPGTGQPPPPPADATQRIDAVPSADPTRRTDRPALEGEAQPIDPENRDADRVDPYGRPYTDAEDEDDGSGRGKSALLVITGLVIGFVAAFIVVALGSSDDAPADDPELAALQEQVASQEAELEERDAVIADQQAQLDAVDSAAGEEAEELQAQRDALDERAGQLDERATQLDERESNLDQRESDLDARDAEPPPEAPEAEVPEEESPEAETPEDPDGEPGESLVDEADSIVDRALEEIRNLFEGEG